MNLFQRRILFALSSTGKHVYAGTADPAKVTRNRKANKAARAARAKGRA